MKYLLLVAHREVRSNRQIFLIAIAIGILPLIFPFVPGLDRWPHTMVRSTSSLFCAIGLALILSVALGWSLIGRDLAERRLSFYFAKPLPSAAIWGGKSLGAILIVATATVLVLIPAEIMGGGPSQAVLDLMGSVSPRFRTRLLMSYTAFLAAFAAVCTFLLAFSHALGLILRSRSGWAAVHFPLLLTSILLGTISARRLAQNEALGALPVFGLALALLVLISLWSALAMQVSMGRTDIVRGHHVLSWVLWPPLIAGLLACDLGTRWLVDVTADDLASIKVVSQANRGTWISLVGRAKYRGDYYPVLLFDTGTGRSLRTGAVREGWPEDLPLISEKGNRAVWLRGRPGEERLSLFMADLDGEPLRTVRVPVHVSGMTFLSISADGTRVALLQPNLVTLYTLPEGEFVGGTSLRAPDQIPLEVQFLSSDVVRIYISHDKKGPVFSRDLEILEFDAAARILVTTGKIGGVSGVVISSDPSIQALITRRPMEEGGQVSLWDARTGEAKKSPLLPGPMGWPRFLADGRMVAMTMQEHENARLHTFTPEGAEIRAIDLPGKWVRLGAEYAPGRLVVAVYQASANSFEQWSLYLVDLESGEVRRRADGLVPLDYWDWRLTIFVLASSLPGGRQRNLYSSADAALVEFDPVTGTHRTLIGPTHFAGSASGR